MKLRLSLKKQKKTIKINQMDHDGHSDAATSKTAFNKLFSKRDSALCIKLQGLVDDRNDKKYHDVIFWYPLKAIGGKEQSEVSSNIETLSINSPL